MQSCSQMFTWLGLGLIASTAACSSSSQPSTNSGGTFSGGMGGLVSTGGKPGSGGTGGKVATGGASGSGGKQSGGAGGTASTGGSGGRTPAGGTGGSTSGGSGGQTTGGTGSGGQSRGPTPATATAKFPFPQNRQSTRCIYPTNYRNEDVEAVYKKWKADVVTSDGAGGHLRVKRPAEPGSLEKNSTVSEGIAYGLIIAVYMNDRTLFDELWKYEQLWIDPSTGLMDWYIKADGSGRGELDGKPSLGAATDADEDMAWALIMADRQWGGGPTSAKTYLDTAKELIGNIWKSEIWDGKLPRNGSTWGDWKDLNISYFAPSEYRVFAKVSGSDLWNSNVVPTVYDAIKANLNEARKNQTNGLVPAWSNSDGGDIVATDRPKHYQYDACRTPFRIGLDACLFGDPKAIEYVGKTSSFFSKIGAANIASGYNLDGTPRPEFSGLSGSFVGPAGVGAMHSATYQGFVNDVYALLRDNNMNAGGLYYDESWTMMSLLMMTGNYLDYTQY